MTIIDEILPQNSQELQQFDRLYMVTALGKTTEIQ